VFSAADVPSAPKPADQVAKQASAVHDHTGPLVTLQDMRDFQSGPQKFQDATTHPNSSDRNTYQTEVQRTNKNDSHSIEYILPKFDLTNNASDHSLNHRKTASADTTVSLSDKEVAAILKNLSVNQISETLAELVKELSAENNKKATAQPLNDSHTSDGAQQHRHAYSTQEQPSEQHHRHAYSTQEQPSEQHHRHAYSTREGQLTQHRDAYSTLESQSAEHHRAVNDSHEAQSRRDVHTMHGRTRTQDEAAINPDHFAEVAKHVIAKVGQNGAVTHEQLAKAVQDPSFTGQEAQVLAALYHKFDQLHNLSGHEMPWSPQTITTGDVDKYQHIQAQQDKESAAIGPLYSWAPQSIARFSSDGNSLNQNDIHKALNNPNTSAYDKQMLHQLDEHWSEMTSWTHPTMTAKDVQDFVTNFSKTDQHKLVSDVEWACRLSAMHGQKADICHDLYAGDPLDSIKHGDIKQGLCGDCYFEAAVAGLARSNPEAIKQMITDNHDGTYTVAFPGRDTGERPITVTAPTETELGLYNGGSKYGCWASVLEKAYGQYRENHEGQLAQTPEDFADGGGNPGPVFKLLTGKDSTDMNVNGTSQADMATALQHAFESKPPLAVAAVIDGDSNLIKWIGQGSDNTADGFYKEHVYTITGVGKDANGQLMVEIRNPWDNKNVAKGAHVTIPLSEFMKDFNSVSIQGR